METRTLFLFGECTENHFFKEFPVSIETTRPYVLSDYQVHYTDTGRSYLVAAPGSQTAGFLCDAPCELLWAMDQWKEIPTLYRSDISIDCEGTKMSIDIYLSNGDRDYFYPSSTLAENLAYFNYLYGENELGKCDVHLMFPCSFDSFRKIANKNIFMEPDHLSKSFIEKIAYANATEFSGEYLTLERDSLGVYTFRLDFDLEGEENRDPSKDHLQSGFIHFSVHKPTKVGTVSIVFPNTTVSALQVLNVFCSNRVSIIDGNTPVLFLDWLQKRYQITLQGTPRAVLFAHDSLSQEQILHCLAMERVPMAPLIGPTLSSFAADNFAQYDVAEVYASHKCLLEIEKNCPCTLSERFDMESLEIFFVELLSMQTASIHRICSKIISYMNNPETLNGEKHYDQLIALSNEMSSAVLFFDYNYFLYPTVSIACKKISQRFGMEEEMEKYYKYREILEQMISLAQEQREKIESDNMNLLLLILTFVQVIPTFVETFQMIMAGSWSVQTTLSWVYSIVACAILYGLYKIYNHGVLQHTKQNRKRRN